MQETLHLEGIGSFNDLYKWSRGVDGCTPVGNYYLQVALCSEPGP